MHVRHDLSRLLPLVILHFLLSRALRVLRPVLHRGPFVCSVGNGEFEGNSLSVGLARLVIECSSSLLLSGLYLHQLWTLLLSCAPAVARTVLLW